MEGPGVEGVGDDEEWGVEGVGDNGSGGEG